MSLARFRRPVIVAEEGEHVVDVARHMRRARVGCVVVARMGYPVGIVTDRDIALRVVAEGRDPSATTVRDIVTYEPFVIEEESAIETAAARMREHGVRRLPVIDTQGHVVGMVTADDLMGLLGRELADVCSAIEDASDVTESR